MASSWRLVAVRRAAAAHLSPDCYPENLVGYLNGGCKTLRECIEMSAKDYNEATYVTFPEHY